MNALKKFGRIAFSALLPLLASGPAWGQSDVVINEIMYNNPGDDVLEFVELYNKGASSINLVNYAFVQGINHVFENSTPLPAGGYLVLARDAPAFAAFFGFQPDAEWALGALGNNGEGIALINPSGGLADLVEYDDGGLWPSQADGNGVSLVLCNPNLDNQDYANWTTEVSYAGLFSDEPVFASPGAQNCTPPDTDTAPPIIYDYDMAAANTILVTFSEPISNATATDLSHYSGVGVSNVIGSGSQLFVSLALPLETGQYYQLVVNGLQDMAGNPMPVADTLTLVYNNTVGSIQISEIYYHPPNNNPFEFLELHNYGSAPVQLGGYRFKDGITFKFPTYELPAQSFLVLAQDAAAVQGLFGIAGVLQWTGGALNNAGETLVIENTQDAVIDSVDYLPDLPWPPEANGSGPSLEFCWPGSDNSSADGWAASDMLAYIGDVIEIYASPGETNCLSTGFSGGGAAAAELKLHPNPCIGGLLQLSLPNEPARGHTVHISDLAGNIMWESKGVTGQRMYVQTSNWEKGMYFVQAFDPSGKRVAAQKLLLL